MLGLTLLVASIAIADSVNPSTVVPALWLAGAPRGHGLESFTFGVFAIYLAGGLLLVFGPGPAFISALRHIRGPLEHGLLAAVGIAVLVFALVLWRSRHRVSTTHADHPAGPPAGPPRAPRHLRSHKSAFVLGAGIMAFELPTAFVYFGAIMAILAAHRGAPAEVSLLIVYNALFVTPLLGIIAVRRLAGDRADRWLAAGEEWLRRAGRMALTGVAGAGGAALVVIGVSGLLAS